MTLSESSRLSHLFALLTSGALLSIGLVDLPVGPVRTMIQGLRSTEPSAAERETSGGGYYEALLNGANASDGVRDEIALKLLGKPKNWINFHEMQAARYFTDQFLQFELQPNVEKRVFDHIFTTNNLGLRDRQGYTLEKPPGVFRIVLLGSSIDMGWGVETDQTYENQLEDWLNHYAATRGLERRFEVLNFACAAYGPAQRLETYRRKAAAFQPDLVLYSVTMLDPRLSQIHLCELLEHSTDPTYEFVADTIARAGFTPSDLALDQAGDFRNKSRVKEKLKPWLWLLGDGALGTLAVDCRAAGSPIVCLVVPRASLSDNPEGRVLGVARHKAIAARHAVHLIDLSPAFDEEDLSDVELAPWDDHPNAAGHRLIFLSLAEQLLADERLAHLLFDE